MQTTSALWKRLWAAGSARLETVAVIGGVEHADISSPVIKRSLMQGGLGIGNAVSANCTLSVRSAEGVPRAAEVAVRMRLTDGESASEWLPAGTFYVSHRTRDAVTGLVALECYDAMLKANAEYVPGGTWPRSMAQLASELAAALGVSMDPRSRIATGDGYFVEEPEEGTTLHDLLGRIAAANGGNWIITPANRLRLVRLASASDAAGATEDAVDVAGVVKGIDTGSLGTITGIRCTVDGETHLTGDATGLVIDAEVSVPVALDLADWMLGMTCQAYALEGAIYDPAAELGDYVRGGANGEIRGLLNDETATCGLAFRGDIASPEAGEMADEYPYLSRRDRAIDVMRAKLRTIEEDAILGVDVEYAQNQSAVVAPVTGWTTDAPAWREGYYIWQRTATVTSDGTGYSSPTCISGRDGADGATGPQGETGATGVGVSEIVEQYYLSNSSTTRSGGSWSTSQPAWASGKYIWTRSKITWTNGTTTYTTPVLAKAINGANSAANDAGLAVTALDTALTQQEIFNRLTNNGQVQGLYLKNGRLYINATYIDTGVLSADLLTAGVITDASGENYWILDGANSEFVTRKGAIGDFTLDSGSLKYGSLDVGGTGAYVGKNGLYYNQTYSNLGGDTYKTYVFGQGLRLYRNNELYATLFVGATSTTHGFTIRCYDANGNAYDPIYIRSVGPTTYKTVFVRDAIYVFNGITALGSSSFGYVSVSNNLTVSGTKSRVVSTGQYSDRLLYCYETPSPMFGDVGEGVIGEDGKCYVWLDAVFAQTITTSQYQVFLQKYGGGDCWVSERGGSCFVVEGTPGLSFGWELKAKQADFDQRRLEVAVDAPETDATDYGEQALQYINKLREGRVSA